MLTKFENPFTYDNYKTHIAALLENNTTTGSNQSEEYIAYTKINMQRMKRNEKQFSVTQEVLAALHLITKPQTWLVLTEAWCGDAAQNLPAIAAIAALNNNITLQLLLRDENLNLMDQFLTNGGRSIPKLIAIDSNTKNVLFTWGPRPKTAQSLVLDLKKNGVTNYSEPLHKWYAQNKNKDICIELTALLLETSKE